MSRIILWCLLGFFMGSIPFSLLVGRLFLKTDIRRYGDGNPGGANAWKAGGWTVGLVAVLLDMLKGYLPVFLAQRAGLVGWDIVPVALMPILGHAFSPFLKFRGGKALGATGGAWIALIGFKALVIYAILALPVLALQGEDAVSAIAGMLSLLAYAVWFDGSPSLVAFAALNTILITWKHHQELFQPIHLRPWVAGLLNRRGA
jgi:glycerol-3-phosphate acyltransferase PlsY